MWVKFRGKLDGKSEPIDQPWRCLCRGFLQMTRKIPSRRMMRQSLHRRLMDGLTFMRKMNDSFGFGPPVRFKPAAAPNLWRAGTNRRFHLGRRGTESLSHVSRLARRESRFRKKSGALFCHPQKSQKPSFFPYFKIGQTSAATASGTACLDTRRGLGVRMIGSPSVIITECSKCAERSPSAVTTVH